MEIRKKKIMQVECVGGGPMDGHVAEVRENRCVLIYRMNGKIYTYYVIYEPFRQVKRALFNGFDVDTQA